MSSNLDNVIAEILKAEISRHKLEQEDKGLITAYLEGEEARPEVDDFEEVAEPASSGPSQLFKYIYALAQAKDLPEPDLFVLGLVALGEEKWMEKHKMAAWALVKQQYAQWFSRHGYDTSDVLPITDKPKLRKEAVKRVALDNKTGGFVIEFHGMDRDEYIRVFEAVKRIPGWKYHDGTRAGSRLPRPHWTISGDEAAAKYLGWYLYESKRYYAMKRDASYSQAAYWSGMIETVDWEIENGVKERIDFLIQRAEKMIPMSEAHHPSEGFRLHNDYRSIDKKEPFDYQIAGVEYILMCTRESRLSQGLAGNGVYVADPMGTGKSLEAGIIAVAEAWYEELERDQTKNRDDLRAIVIAPANAKIGWYREIERWIGSMGFTCQILRGLSAQRIWANFVIVNPQLLKKEFNKELNIWEPLPLFTILLSQRWFSIVFDEGHKIKNWTAQRTANALELFSGKRWDSKMRKLVQFRLPVPLRLILSGSPILNSPGEYAPQLEALGLLESFGGQARFEVEYGSSIRSLPKVKRVEKMKELHRKLRQFGYLRREKETMVLTDEQKTIPVDTVPPEILNRVFTPPEQWAEVLENQGWRLLPGVLGQLPPKIRSVVHVPITNRNSYKRAEENLLSWIMEEFKNSPNLEEELNRAKRGYILKLIITLKRLAEEGKVKAAIKWLEDFLSETDDQKIVFYTSHLHVQDQFIEHFPGTAVIRGGQSEDLRQKNIDRFQSDPNCRIILCMIQAGGEAITLTAAHHLAFLSLGWNPAIHDQAEDRIWGRVNDLHGASIYYILADDTVDNWMAEVIDKKREVTMASIQGADAETSMMSELVTRFVNKAKKQEWAEVLGVEEDEAEQ